MHPWCNNAGLLTKYSATRLLFRLTTSRPPLRHIGTTRSTPPHCQSRNWHKRLTPKNSSQNNQVTFSFKHLPCLSTVVWWHFSRSSNHDILISFLDACCCVVPIIDLYGNDLSLTFGGIPGLHVDSGPLLHCVTLPWLSRGAKSNLYAS